jgi:hypothetical protein
MVASESRATAPVRVSRSLSFRLSPGAPRCTNGGRDALDAAPVDPHYHLPVAVLTIGVECYAGHRGEQTPRTLVIGDRRIGVAEVVDAWLAPDHRYFKLKGEDGDTYMVRHDERSGTWELTMFRAE